MSLEGKSLGETFGESREAKEGLGRESRESTGNLKERPQSLKDAIAYRPEEIAAIVERVTSESNAYRKCLANGEFSSQLKGAVAEKGLKEALLKFGQVEKLEVSPVKGSHTADFKHVLGKPMEGQMVGDSIIWESKDGKLNYILNELRNPTSHARMQLAETMEKHGAKVGIVCVPREIQNNRSLFEQAKLDMAKDGMKMLCVLPHEGAVRSAFEIARSRLVT